MQRSIKSVFNPTGKEKKSPKGKEKKKKKRKKGKPDRPVHKFCGSTVSQVSPVQCQFNRSFDSKCKLNWARVQLMRGPVSDQWFNQCSPIFKILLKEDEPLGKDSICLRGKDKHL